MDETVKPPKKRGRRTKLDPEVTKIICEAIERGNTLKNAAALAGVGQTAFYRWMSEDESPGPEFKEFREKVNGALAKSQDIAVTAFVSAFGDDWRAAQEYLARRHPEDWAKKDNLKVEAAHSGEIVVKVQRIDSNGNVIQ